MWKRRLPKHIKKKINITFLVIIFIIIFAVSFSVTFVTKQQNYRAKASSPQPAPFSFTFAGDFSKKINTDAVLNTIKNSGADFNLAVGDLAYSSGTPSEWGNYVQSIVGSTFPFEIVSGNHDDSLIDQFASALPDKIGGITGVYAKEYYFDYPLSLPSARIIMISPNLLYGYSYDAGTPNNTWLTNAIDSARSAGIPWVIVGMHKNCISMGVKSCSIGRDLMNLLINKRVDLVLQGHDHNYQRSKQLKCAYVGTFDNSCVANALNTLTRGQGTIFLISGTGGHGLYSINTTDSESGYFANWMGSNINPTWGAMKLTVAVDRIDGVFLRASGGDFSDNFSIINNVLFPTPTFGSATPTSTPNPTFTPTNTPIPQQTPTPAAGNSFSLNPIADTYVTNNSITSNYGTKSTVAVDGSPIEITYLKFDLTSLAGKTVISAKLLMRSTNGSSSTQVLKYVTDISWGETTMNYNNRPLMGAVITSFVGGSSGAWKEVDITSTVASLMGQITSFGIDSAGSDGYDFASRESGNKPVLQITTQ